MRKLETKQAVTLERPWHTQSRSFRGGKAEAAVVGRIADENDRTVTAPPRHADCVAHQGRANPAIAVAGGDRDRSQEQSRLAGTADDVPKSGGADNTLAVRRDEGEPFGRRPAVSQPLRAFAPALGAKRLIKERFTRRSVGRPFFPDRDHLASCSCTGAQPRALNEVLLG